MRVTIGAISLAFAVAGCTSSTSQPVPDTSKPAVDSAADIAPSPDVSTPDTAAPRVDAPAPIADTLAPKADAKVKADAKAVADSTTKSDGPADCRKIAADQNAAILAARACNPLVRAILCTTKMSPLPCACPVFINPSNTAAAAKIATLGARWKAAACKVWGPCPSCAPLPSNGICRGNHPTDKTKGRCEGK